jgi:hypothetical protein
MQLDNAALVERRIARASIGGGSGGRGKYAPTWWKSIEHDKHLLMGVTKWGLQLNKISQDTNLPFHAIRVPNSAVQQPTGKDGKGTTKQALTIPVELKETFTIKVCIAYVLTIPPRASCGLIGNVAPQRLKYLCNLLSKEPLPSKRRMPAGMISGGAGPGVRTSSGLSGGSLSGGALSGGSLSGGSLSGESLSRKSTSRSSSGSSSPSGGSLSGGGAPKGLSGGGQSRSRTTTSGSLSGGRTGTGPSNSGLKR